MVSKKDTLALSRNWWRNRLNANELYKKQFARLRARWLNTSSLHKSQGRRYLWTLARSPQMRSARLCVSKAIDYLEAHVDQPIKVDELARLCCMSKRNFARAFRAATGSAPIAYLVNLRLARAGALLRRYDETVTSVAYKVGFNDSSYFTRQFHEMFGVAPSHYRKRQGLV